jgi:benzoyl-CoA reductase/2-hydroxyglutaryl-CoA dehydratase subunit BcrC/BadD/HgdB
LLLTIHQEHVQSEQIMTEIPQVPVDRIPLPEMEVVMEMHVGIGNRLAEISQEKTAGKPIVWASIITPKEILYAMDVPVTFQEILGAWISIMGMSGHYCQIAEEHGVSRDVCAIHRCFLGCALADERDPFFDAAFVEPDLVLGTTYACMSVSKSFQLIADKFGCPQYVFDSPINAWGRELPDHAIEYYAEQYRGLIRFLEQHGFTLDWDRLKKEVQFTIELNQLAEEIDRYKSAVPSPIKSYDSFVALTAPIALPKEMRKIELFERLRDELKERVERGHSVVEEEKLRLLWVGIPPVCDLSLLNHVEKHGAIVAKNMLEYLVGVPLDPSLLDPEKPLESIAHAVLSNPVNPLYSVGVDWIVKMAKRYKVDGAISVVKRTCGLVPGMQKLVRDALLEEVGVPSVVFDLDAVDEREFDEVATKQNLDSFVETLLAKKGR